MRKLPNYQPMLVDVLETLNLGADSLKSDVRAVLKRVCGIFSFACSFIYESDHTKTLFLKEKYVAYPTTKLPVTMNPEGLFTEEQMEELVRKPVVFFDKMHIKDGLAAKFSEVFSANSLIIVPITGDNSELYGLVGLIDRRSSLNMDEERTEAAIMFLTIVSNYAKLRIVQRLLAHSRATMLSIMDNLGIDIYVNDYNTHELLYVNASMAAPYGGSEKMLGKPCWDVIYDEQPGECEFCPKSKLIDENGNPTNTYTWDYQRPFDGSWFRVICAAFRWVDGRLAHVVSSIDITDAKKNELLIEKMAYYDDLTGIPNRRKLEKDFNELLLGGNPVKDEHALLFLDLDDFKLINDTKGHKIGDILLRVIAQTLNQDAQSAGMVYRYGGDEFILLIKNTNKEAIASLGDYLVERFNAPWEIGGGALTCRASIGYAVYPRDGDSYNRLLYCADKAMYDAKKAGKGKLRRFGSPDA